MTEHYFSKEPSSQGKQYILSLQGRGVHGEFVVSSGVFSKSRLDQGSSLLIENAVIEAGWKILDLGCGYGPIGILLAKAFPDAGFLLSDVNQRAVHLARLNCKRNYLQNAIVRSSDGFDGIPEIFDSILLNPPQTAGKKVCIQLFEDSFYHLKNKGILQVVARHNKGGASLSKEMERIFGNVRTTARKSGYHVYVSEKRN